MSRRLAPKPGSSSNRGEPLVGRRALPHAPNSGQSSRGRLGHVLASRETGLAYEMDALSLESHPIVEKGLCDSKLSVSRWSKQGGGYCIELHEPIKITISDNRAPVCSACPPDREGRACKHIWWVDDQILEACHRDERCQVRVDEAGTRVLGRDIEGQASEGEAPFYVILENIGIDRLAERRGWQRGQAAVERDTTEILSVYKSLGGLSRLEHVRHWELFELQMELQEHLKRELVNRLVVQPDILDALRSDATQQGLKIIGLASEATHIFDDFLSMNRRGIPTNDAIRPTTGRVVSLVGKTDELLGGRPRSLRARLSIAELLIFVISMTVKCDCSPTLNDSGSHTGVRPRKLSLLHHLIRSKPDFALRVLEKCGSDVLKSDHMLSLVKIALGVLTAHGAPGEYISLLASVAGLKDDEDEDDDDEDEDDDDDEDEDEDEEEEDDDDDEDEEDEDEEDEDEEDEDEEDEDEEDEDEEDEDEEDEDEEDEDEEEGDEMTE